VTGSKSAVRDAGSLLGAAALATVSFQAAVIGMAAALALILAAVAVFMPPGPPRGRKDAKSREVFSKDANINRLSAARMFLFGASDTWFVVGAPISFLLGGVGRNRRGQCSRSRS
jgi:hypothetical protein